MHTYNKSGIRKAKVAHTNKVKKGVKTFYTKLNQINKLAEYLQTLDTPVTEDNIDEVVPELIGRDLDSTEKMLILGRLHKED